MRAKVSDFDFEFKKCNKCKEMKTLDNFYVNAKGYLIPKCADCIKDKDRLETLKKKEENGGSMIVAQNCNVYFDEFQKENTFKVMKLLGYTYNEEFGIWIKPGWKEIKNGEPFFPKLKEYKQNYTRVRNAELIEKIISCRKRGFTFARIAIKFNISSTTCQKIWKIYGTETRENR